MLVRACSRSHGGAVSRLWGDASASLSWLPWRLGNPAGSETDSAAARLPDGAVLSGSGFLQPLRCRFYAEPTMQRSLPSTVREEAQA